jgi:hypothetical protein
MVSGEGLTRGAPQVFATLLHEVAHDLARAREIRDTSREGRYHNRRFKRLAEELGLRVECHERRGWAVTELDPECQLAYDDTVATLERAMVAYRDREQPRSQQARRQGLVAAMCGCGRRIRIASSVLDRGAILCGVCEEPFVLSASGVREL